MFDDWLVSLQQHSCLLYLAVGVVRGLDTISYTADIFVSSAAICLSTFSIGLKISFMVSRADFFGCSDSSTLQVSVSNHFVSRFD